MINTRKLLALLIFTLFIETTQAQITSPDTLVHRIFTALKNKDEKAFVALYPNQEQMTKMMSKIMAGLITEIAKMDTTNKKKLIGGDFNEMMLEELKKKTKPEQMEKEFGRFAKNFRDIIEKGEQRGIDWNRITLLRYSYDSITMKDETAVKLFGTDGMKTMEGKLYFTSADSVYQVSFHETLYLPEERGWYGAELHQLKKENETLADDTEIKEVMMESIEEDVPPPPPPPPSKQKTKTTSSKTKTKTKTKS